MCNCTSYSVAKSSMILESVTKNKATIQFPFKIKFVNNVTILAIKSVQLK